MNYLENNVEGPKIRREDMAATIEQVNMTEGALLPKIIRFSLPLAATGVLHPRSRTASCLLLH